MFSLSCCTPVGRTLTVGLLALLIGAWTAGPALAQDHAPHAPTEASTEAPTEAAADDEDVWWDPDDPRIGLAAGWYDAEEAAQHMELLASLPRPDIFVDADNPGDLNFANSDIAFRDHYAIVGNFYGFMIYDIANPQQPTLEVAVVCPGGQGDVSIYGDLIFMSVEQTRGRIDCGVMGAPGRVNEERFRGVRIFDISDLTTPKQVAAVQTCRGSHTHTILDDPNDDENLYVYVSGTSFVRSGEELEGCVPLGPDESDDTSFFRIEVIQVPLDAPQDARVVSEPRVFADEETGRVDGLWPGGDHGEGTQRSRQTNQCHDITVYPEIGLAAGACSGNGILLDITDPVNPVRIDAVADENFAYWHSASFNNDGTKVLFTDEWGGGTSPRCRADDPVTWGANAIFTLEDGVMTQASYYKIPVVQTSTENCVAHNGSLIPVPGRDIKAQAWYQGGVSVFDFTDPDDPFEIAFFDRGPMSDDELQVAGYWSTYWYNGYIYGTEIARGFDVLELTPSEHLSENELAAAKLVTYDEFNPQHQPRNTWPASFVVPHALLDQLDRNDGLAAERRGDVRETLEAIEAMSDRPAQQEALDALAEALQRDAANGAADADRVVLLAEAVHDLAASMR